MPSRVYRTFKAFGASDEVISLVADSIKKEGMKEANKGNIGRLEVCKKSYREDIVVGDVYIVPPSVCKSAEDFPTALLASGIIKKMNIEEAIELKENLLASTEVSKDTLKLAKKALFTDHEGKEAVLIVFMPAWGGIYDAQAFPYNEETIYNDVRDIIFAAQFDPSLSSCFEQVQALDKPYRVEAIPMQQNIFKVPAIAGENYPVLAKGEEVVREEQAITPAEPTIGKDALKDLKIKVPKKAAITKNFISMAASIVPSNAKRAKIRLNSAHFQDLEKAVLDDKELQVFNTLKEDVEEKTASPDVFSENKCPECSTDLVGISKPKFCPECGKKLSTASQKVYSETSQGDTGLRNRPDYGEPGSKENPDMKLVQSSTKVLDGEVEMPKKEFIQEHKKLVDTLKHPSKEKLQEELKEQGGELKKMEASKKAYADTDQYCHNPICHKLIKGKPVKAHGVSYCSEACVKEHDKSENDSEAIEASKKSAGKTAANSKLLKKKGYDDYGTHNSFTVDKYYNSIIESKLLQDILETTTDSEMITRLLKKGIKDPMTGKSALESTNRNINLAIRMVVDELISGGEIPHPAQQQMPQITEEDKKELHNLGIQGKKKESLDYDPLKRKPVSEDHSYDTSRDHMTQNKPEKLDSGFNGDENSSADTAVEKDASAEKPFRDRHMDADDWFLGENDYNVLEENESENTKDTEELNKEKPKDLIHSTKKEAFTLLVPGQVLEGFYPELAEELTYKPVGEELWHSQTPEELQGEELLDSQGEAGDSANSGRKSPIDNGTEYQGVPLRKELNLRGPAFSDTFYAPHDDVNLQGLRLSSLKKKASKEENKAKLAAFLKLVVGDIAASFIMGFRATQKPVLTDIPTQWNVDLTATERMYLLPTGGFMAMDQESAGLALGYLVKELNDSDISEILNDTYAQAAVWNGSEDGYVYEVFVRAEKLNIDSRVLTVTYINKKNESKEIIKTAKEHEGVKQLKDLAKQYNDQDLDKIHKLIKTKQHSKARKHYELYKHKDKLPDTVKALFN